MKIKITGTQAEIGRVIRNCENTGRDGRCDSCVISDHCCDYNGAIEAAAEFEIVDGESDG